MSLKSMRNRVTGAMARQTLTVKTHSPVLLLGLGAVGFTTTVVLACRATLKLSDVLEEGNELLNKVDVKTENEDEEVKKKAKIGAKLQVAIRVAKLYAPSVAIGLGTLTAITGAHVILTRRNTALTAALGVATKTFQDYRARVVEDQGTEKDLEYRWGTAEREVVEETETGPVTTVLKGLDQEAIKKEIAAGSVYARLFDEDHEDWSEFPHQNQTRIENVQNMANTLLRVDGFVTLNQVYEMLGFERTAAGQVVGWVVNPKDGRGDGVIDFGVWNEGVYEGKKWINGNKQAILLDFNVDGEILSLMKQV
ncbi:membrane protein [Streptomyces phage Maya]|uniref:Uncharacterized protein n=12 Tax=Rimavirus rima TaxID=2560784 RepID=A0A515MIS2_9CAUD|nr:hypothetical protein SEA_OLYMPICHELADO_57 [Streptomyces phage OlympicHelado]QAY16268.1 hypothetical protein SEA_ICEWARRIOR_56 [Streptomyces phage IceWarrior]QDM56558.1 hypothetical protein SEA_ESKETIT_57 [Streptomyces phage Esketit]QEQ93750.1 hypothetical protein SEA_JAYLOCIRAPTOR_57 [Streptomyces phage Jaylociraptor]QEQ94002.1 hypothetical protein SEA_MEIBYSRARUS_55 [Streptomyces phage Meibysrarus]QEQ94273.1 hypothetical protein SEA_HOSHI_56 [Streptomyces phage Hoshi]QGJ96756.1 hypothetic